MCVTALFEMMNWRDIPVSLSKYRLYYMGCSMLMVVLYHWRCVCAEPLYLRNFEWGYIGVDVFVFLSGMGLCYAYNKYNLFVFYTRRFLRLYPIYALTAIVCTLIWSLIHARFPGLSIWLCELSGMQSLGMGPFFDWYLSFLFLLYLIFPVLYRLRHVALVIGLYMLAYMVLSNYIVPWQLSCMISRLYIFVLGMMAYETIMHRLHVTRLGVLCLCITIAPFVLEIHDRFLLASSFLPVVLLVLYTMHLFLTVVDKRMLLGKAIDYVGKNSIIVYASNVVSMHSMVFLDPSMNDSLAYWLLQVVWYIVLYYANKFLLAPVAAFIVEKVETLVCKLGDEEQMHRQDSH